MYIEFGPRTHTHTYYDQVVHAIEFHNAFANGAEHIL